MTSTRRILLAFCGCFVFLQLILDCKSPAGVQLYNDDQQKSGDSPSCYENKCNNNYSRIRVMRDKVQVDQLKASVTSLTVNLRPDYLAKSWIGYNPSVLKLPGPLWKRFCQNLLANPESQCAVDTTKDEEEMFLISFFTKKPGQSYGSTIWLGITTFHDLYSNALHNTSYWRVPPSMVQNVAGPKAADPRLFLLEDGSKLALVAYTGIHERTSEQKRAGQRHRDYLVRVGVVETRPRNSVAPCSSNINADDTTAMNPSSCPPQPDASHLVGEFFVDCDYATTHCADGYMGVEANREAYRRVSQKNLQPIAVDTHPAVSHLIDFTPPDGAGPMIYTIQMDTGALVARTAMEFPGSSNGPKSQCQLLATQVWRGSVQVVRDPQTGLYITLVHKRSGFHYDHRLVILRIAPLGEVGIRVQCLHVSAETETAVRPVPETKFQFPVGFTHVQGQQYLVTFGADNQLSLAHTIDIDIDIRVQHAEPSAAVAVAGKDPYAFILPTIGTSEVPQFFSLFVALNGSVTPTRLQQFVKCFSSLHYHHPGAPIHFLTDTSHAFVAQLRKLVPFVNIVNTDMKRLLEGTPVDGLPYNTVVKCRWKERSDLVRLLVLWKWGGTWIDTDDIIIRPIPATTNVLSYLEWPGVKSKIYWGSNFQLIDGKWKTLGMRNMQDGFHFQNDPLVNFAPRNPFVGRWIEEIVRNDPNCTDWGQKVPTDLFLQDPLWASRYLNPVPQHSVLLHPAFGNKQKKGTMFPLYDYRLPADFPHYDTVVTQAQFQGYFQQMVQAQPFFAVKVKDEHYNLAGQDKMFIPAWIANTELENLTKLIPIPTSTCWNCLYSPTTTASYSTNLREDIDNAGDNNALQINQYRQEIANELRRVRGSKPCIQQRPFYVMKWGPGKNFGDDLNVDLASVLLGVSLENVVTTTDATRPNKIVAIGSVLTQTAPGDIVLGTGLSFGSKNALPESTFWKQRLAKATIVSVRGPDTRASILDRGIPCPNMFGDLGVTTSLLIWPDLKPATASSKEVCIIPHLTDYTLQKEAKESPHTVLSIAPSTPRILAQEMMECGLVVSSSLHAIMIADTYQLKVRWYSGPDSNSKAKYLDYFRGIGAEDTSSASTLKEAIAMGPMKPALTLEKMRNVTLQLIHSFPFDQACKRDAEHDH